MIVLRGLVAAALLAAAAALPGDAVEDLASPDPALREAARAALDADPSGDLALRALRSPSPLAREAAADCLLAHPDRAGPAQRAALRGLLAERGGARTARAAAARALGAAGDAGAARELRAALPELPVEAALALAELRDAGALPDLRALRAASGDAVPAEVAYALAVLGDPEGGPLLLRRLEDADPAVSAAALHLLRRWTGLDHGPSVAPWSEALRLRSLAARLADRDWEAGERALQEVLARGAAGGPDLLAILGDRGAAVEGRAKAALGLGLLRWEEAGPALLEASRIGRDPWLRVYALEALGRIAWAPAAPDIARMLVNDEDPEPAKTFFDSTVPYHEVQGAGARALLDMGCEGALALFADQLSRGGVGILPTALVADYKIRIPWTALGVLREFGGPAAGDGFGYLPEAGEAERRAAGERIAAWWRSRPRDFAVPLRARFEDPLFAAGVDREIGILGRYKFLEMDRSRRALILLGSPALPRLTAALVVAPEADPSGQQRIGVAQVLQEIGRPEAAGPLRTALARAEIPPVRIQMVRSLAALGPPGGVPEAVRLLGSPLPDERAAAAEALALCPTPDSRAAIRGALAGAGEDPPLRIALATALLGLRDPEGMRWLLPCLSDPETILRRRAFEGMDRWVEGLGPFDPRAADPGPAAAEVGRRWAAQAAAPRFRAPGGAGR